MEPSDTLWWRRCILHHSHRDEWRRAGEKKIKQIQKKQRNETKKNDLSLIMRRLHRLEIGRSNQLWFSIGLDGPSEDVNQKSNKSIATHRKTTPKIDQWRRNDEDDSFSDRFDMNPGNEKKNQRKMTMAALTTALIRFDDSDANASGDRLGYLGACQVQNAKLIEVALEEPSLRLWPRHDIPNPLSQCRQLWKKLKAARQKKSVKEKKRTG